jgi:hypothetical protein
MKTQVVSITKVNWLTLFKKIIAVYTEKHKKHIHSVVNMLNYWLLKTRGTYSYHYVLKY